MTVLIARDFERCIDNLPENAAELWLFEGVKARRAAESYARANGRQVRIHSAYKTLLHDVIELDLLEGSPQAVIHYPVIAGCDEDRFLSECYPLDALFADCDIQFSPLPHDGTAMPVYRVGALGRVHEVPVPVQWREAAGGSMQLAACGWLVDTNGCGHPLETEYEQIFLTACDFMRNMSLVPIDAHEPDGPFFERLEISVSLPTPDEPLPVGNEMISLREIMHEEIYFTALEIFRARLGLDATSREVKCGQIIPILSDGSPGLRISLNASTPQSDGDQPGRPVLDLVSHWLYPAQIAAHLSALGGVSYACTSRQGRRVEGRYVKGQSPAGMAISAGQHANESSPVIGALRAAKELAADGRLSFTVNPLENPDGYALFRELCQGNPRHMQHAARYTASGADISCSDGRFEGEIRQLAQSHLPARVHLNLHGYPSREWTRPLSGYIPFGFSEWVIPRGFFLILRYDPAEKALADRLLNAALAELAGFDALASQNRRMLALYRRYVRKSSFRVFDDCIAYSVQSETGAAYPITLTTEAPDETVYGEDFRMAHEAHYRVVRAVAAELRLQAAVLNV